jgi:predicted restriction endonuclease
MTSFDEITIQIDTEAAQAYKSASPEEKKKIDFLISAWLKEVTSKDKSSLKQLMDEISDKAQARGLTPEILETY